MRALPGFAGIVIQHLQYAAPTLTNQAAVHVLDGMLASIGMNVTVLSILQQAARQVETSHASGIMCILPWPGVRIDS